MEVGKYIKFLRVQKGISQEELGKVVGVQRAAVQKWESGATQNLKRITMQKLADYFNVNPCGFVSDDLNEMNCDALCKTNFLQQQSPYLLTKSNTLNIKGERIKKLREEEGLTQEEVGKAIGVTKATVNRYETEEIDIKRTIAIKLAHVLHTVPSYIMGWTDEKNPDLTSKHEPPILTKYNKLNNKGKEKTDSYVDDLLESPKYTKAIESNLDRTVFGHETYPRAVAAPDITTHIDKRKKKVRHT